MLSTAELDRELSAIYSNLDDEYNEQERTRKQELKKLLHEKKLQMLRDAVNDYPFLRMGQEDLYRKFMKTQQEMKLALAQKKKLKQLMKYVDPINRDAQYYPSAMEEKEKLKAKYSNSKYYNMGYTYEMAKRH